MPSHKSVIQTWLPIILGIVIVLLIGGGILAWQYLWVPPVVEVPIGEVPEEVEKPAVVVKDETAKVPPVVEVPIGEVPEEVEKPAVVVIKDETADWKTYQEDPYSDLQPHKPWGYEFRYPNEFTLNLGDHPTYPTGSFLKAHYSGAGVWSANVVVSVTLPQSVYPGTNFQSAWLTVAYDPDIANLPNCQELESNRIVEKMTESQVINGVTWYKGITSGAAAGTTIESRVYHTFHNDMCYEVSLHLSAANIGNFDPALGIKAVDESVVWAKLENILSTFKFIK